MIVAHFAVSPPRRRRRQNARMRYGIGINTSRPVGEIVDRARRLADDGFDSLTCSQIFDYDALTLLAVVGAQVPGIGLITTVVPTYPRHPITLAAQALTVQAATGNRLTLGIGLSHEFVIEHIFGYSFEKPARHMKEYLCALMPLLNEQAVSYAGETLKASASLGIDAAAPDVLVAALGPTMLKLAGERAQGTATWMTGPKTLEAHIIPTINAAAVAAGRPAPRIAAAFPVCVTDDPDAARAKVAEDFAIYGTLPSYKAMLDKEGAADPGGAAIIGDESSVTEQIHHLDAIGVTDFAAAPVGSPDDIQRTMALLRELIRSR
jgi:5,10-methylenetetrahydromethanopterin reductase